MYKLAGPEHRHDYQLGLREDPHLASQFRSFRQAGITGPLTSLKAAQTALEKMAINTKQVGIAIKSVPQFQHHVYTICKLLCFISGSF